MRTTLGPAQKMHLDRAARTAGEAFAFDEPDTVPRTNRSLGPSLLWFAIAGVALVALGLTL